jgi:hypothetical protein
MGGVRLGKGRAAARQLFRVLGSAFSGLGRGAGALGLPGFGVISRDGFGGALEEGRAAARQLFRVLGSVFLGLGRGADALAWPGSGFPRDGARGALRDGRVGVRLVPATFVRCIRSGIGAPARAWVRWAPGRSCGRAAAWCPGANRSGRNVARGRRVSGNGGSQGPPGPRERRVPGSGGFRGAAGSGERRVPGAPGSRERRVPGNAGSRGPPGPGDAGFRGALRRCSWAACRGVALGAVCHLRCAVGGVQYLAHG